MVLLGDLLELRHGPERDALQAARVPLTELGAGLAAEAEVVIVPGNHDHQLLAGWFERRARSGPPPSLGLQTPVEIEPDDALAQIAGWLGPERVSAAYPGIWLRDDVYATHGHYADLHLTMPTIERLAAGVMGRIVGLRAGGPRSAEQYEAALVPIYAWIHAVAQRIAPELSGHLHGGSVRGWNALDGARTAPRPQSRPGRRLPGPDLRAQPRRRRAAVGGPVGTGAAPRRPARNRAGPGAAGRRAPVRDLRPHAPRRAARRATRPASGAPRPALSSSTAAAG